MELQYGKEYRNLYEQHWWWRSREEAVVDLLRSRNVGSSRNILDVGCGDALFFDRLAEFGSVEGLEADARLLSAASRYRSNIYVQPFDKSFQPGKSYGLIVMLDVLEHLADPAEALCCVHKLLEPGGIFLLTVPAFSFLWTNHDIINHHRVRYRKKTLLPLLEDAGFSVTFARYWFHWTVPGKILVHLVEKITASAPTLPEVPPAWLNKLLYRVSRLEQRVVSPLRPPLGSTLVALCEKR